MKRLCVLLAGLFLLSLCCCVKKNDDSLLCNGNGASMYRPLALGDSWHYETDAVPNANYDTVVGQSGSSYYICNFLPLNIIYKDTFRVAANGDIYITNASFGVEHLLVPANPSVGQNWLYKDTSGLVYHESILSITASVSTSQCLYNNCLEIQDSLNDNLINLVYYAKGVGVVESNILNAGKQVSTAQLSGVSLH